jgi:hypothetical protein
VLYVSVGDQKRAPGAKGEQATCRDCDLHVSGERNGWWRLTFIAFSSPLYRR